MANIITESRFEAFECKHINLTEEQKRALHAFKRNVAHAFAECQKVVDPELILAILIEDAAVLNREVIAKEMGINK
jgi:hypothetical protein